TPCVQPAASLGAARRALPRGFRRGVPLTGLPAHPSSPRGACVPLSLALPSRNRRAKRLLKVDAQWQTVARDRRDPQMMRRQLCCPQRKPSAGSRRDAHVRLSFPRNACENFLVVQADAPLHILDALASDATNVEEKHEPATSYRECAAVGQG